MMEEGEAGSGGLYGEQSGMQIVEDGYSKMQSVQDFDLDVGNLMAQYIPMIAREELVSGDSEYVQVFFCPKLYFVCFGLIGETMCV